MSAAADIAVAVVAVLHLYFLVLEIFLWDKPFGRRVFRLTPEFAAASKSLAANQGLYNGFLAAGLVCGLLAGAQGHAIKLFFLGCVIIAGIFGAATARKNTFCAGLARRGGDGAGVVTRVNQKKGAMWRPFYLSFPCRRESRRSAKFWMPASAGMTSYLPSPSRLATSV